MRTQLRRCPRRHARYGALGVDAAALGATLGAALTTGGLQHG